jgi:nicotinic acid phosphoribosyltransferase
MIPAANNWNSRTNMSMLTDFYELTMGKGYLEQGLENQIAYFDLFFRQVPEQGGYANHGRRRADGRLFEGPSLYERRYYFPARPLRI